MPESPEQRSRQRPVVRIIMVPPGLSVDCDVRDVAALLRDAGGPFARLVHADSRPDDATIELDYVAPKIEPAVARTLILESVRERASMDARLARWVINAVSPSADQP